MATHIDLLVSYHGKSLTSEQLRDYIWFFDNEKVRAEEIIARWKYKNAPTDRFPTVSNLTAIAYDLRNEEWDRTKHNSPTLADWRRSAKSELAKQTVKLVDSLDEGRLNKNQYVAKMRELDTQFPGIGWAEEAYKLEQHLDKMR